ncbi:ATP-binding protein [Paracoccus sp. 1_MG-2023]|uniref:hybrid sensor histidine kinase/response regulator n=1 Tax=unclassified Paracoccus (in: a-proteobacteria) TaxID=2688777 RepID=UPI0020910116|nr:MULTISPECIES: PAS domain-containing hybrid sensor histidine kinase/response regulator [unclassified Paracoccus (in: a-proteobacteria)]MDO6668764.1 ATP-binding protein [Paracoccus sp. 1_MG-2023]
MGFLDRHLHASRNATMTALPLLLAPLAIGAGVLMVSPGAAFGRTAIIGASIAVAWYLLGGALSLQQALRGIASRRALRAIRGEVAASEDAVWICDPDGHVLFQNPAAMQGFEDYTGRPITGLFTRRRADADGDIRDLITRAWRYGTAELSVGPDETLVLGSLPDAPLQIWTLQREGSDRAAIDIAMTLEADMVDEFDAVPVALLRLAGDGSILRANRSARDLLAGRLNAEGQNLAAILDGPGRPLVDWIADAADGRAVNTTEMLRLRHPEGRGADLRERHYQVTLARDPARGERLTAVMTDASALKMLEAQFAQSQKMQAVGQLAGGVAHDFNNLLTAISGHCDLLMLHRDQGDPDYADLDQISQNANRAAALVGQLLAFSRKQTLRLEVLNLRETLADLTHLLNRLVGERVALSITYDPSLQAIRADKRQLEQVIMNLVVNARDAMADGGQITVRAENAVIDDAVRRDDVSMPPGDYVRIVVRDEGTGIAPEHLAKIFEPFFTTKRIGEGTGLGLSTAYGIVKQTGGYIFCDSELGKGTVFSIYFPANRMLAEGAAPAAPQPTTRSRTIERTTVLLVEDEAPVRAFAARALRLKGHEVIEAGSGEEALTVLANHDGTVDIFVTDVVMPGLDGPAWVREACKTHGTVQVIFMSGYTEDVFVDGQIPIEGAAFLPKPFTLAELSEAVARQLAERRPA